MENEQVYWALGWAICGILAYGLTLAHFQRKFPLIADEHRSEDYTFALVMCMLGPIGLFVAVLKSRHGFMWRLPPIDKK